jgi:Na+/H+ antiporter NhaD/arsenite permease-like protein
MLKTLKLIRSIVVNIGLVALALLAVANGGQPTIIGVLGLLVLGAYNGLEFSDYLALVQAYQEVQQEGGDDQ